MCTAVISIPPGPGPVRLLAIRDEDPTRDWADLGEHWPDRPGVLGIADLRAGGAWLAADPATGRVAVLLNRAELVEGDPDLIPSRGGLPLASVAGQPVPTPPPHHGFNLVELDVSGATVTTWDGHQLTTTALPPGVHMVAHDGVDDPATARIARWLPQFRAADPEQWLQSWLGVVSQSGTLDPFSDQALIRDNLAFGIDTRSLLLTLAQIDQAGLSLSSAVLDRPGRWAEPRWTSPLAH